MNRYRPDSPIAAASALAFRGDRVLLIRRVVEPNKGRWGLPGGAVELGESVREAARREAREETGLAVEPGRVVDVVDVIVPKNSRPDYHYVLTVFLARVVGGRLRAATDAEEARWVRIGDLPALDVTDTTLHVIRKALRDRRRHM
jgi:ADP-ribose pyrophosphatase YjhB (NUDIX family)